jgi:hypothetical protein
MIVLSLALLCFRSEDADMFDLSCWHENNIRLVKISSVEESHNHIISMQTHTLYHLQVHDDGFTSTPE